MIHPDCLRMLYSSRGDPPFRVNLAQGKRGDLGVLTRQLTP